MGRKGRGETGWGENGGEILGWGENGWGDFGGGKTSGEILAGGFQPSAVDSIREWNFEEKSKIQPDELTQDILIRTIWWETHVVPPFVQSISNSQ